MLQQDLPVCHNIYVMHVVKSVGDHLLPMILDVKDKKKDGISAREDLQKNEH